MSSDSVVEVTQKCTEILNKMSGRIESALDQGQQEATELLAASGGDPPVVKAAAQARTPQAQMIYTITNKAENLASALQSLEEHIASLPPVERRMDVESFLEMQSHAQPASEGVRLPDGRVLGGPRRGGALPDPQIAAVNAAASSAFASDAEIVTVASSANKGAGRVTRDEIEADRERLARARREMGRKKNEDAPPPPDVGEPAETTPDTDRVELLNKKVQTTGKERIVMEVRVEKCKFWLGENMQFVVEVQNNSSRKFSQMECSITKRVIKYRKAQDAEGKAIREAFEQKDSMVEAKKVIPHGFPVEPFKGFKGQVKFKVPYELEESKVGAKRKEEQFYFFHLQLGSVGNARGGPEVILGPVFFMNRFVDGPSGELKPQ